MSDWNKQDIQIKFESIGTPLNSKDKSGKWTAWKVRLLVRLAFFSSFQTVHFPETEPSFERILRKVRT